MGQMYNLFDQYFRTFFEILTNSHSVAKCETFGWVAILNFENHVNAVYNHMHGA